MWSIAFKKNIILKIVDLNGNILLLLNICNNVENVACLKPMVY